MNKAKGEKIILGIDPGTNVMGYGIIKAIGQKAEMVAMGVIDMRKQDDPYLRLGHIFERVTGIIDSYLPDEMAIEAPFFGKNVQSMLKLGRAQGIAIAAAIHHEMGFFWTGFYCVKNNELVLGPFQGPVACTRIGFGKGVCGSSWKEKRTLVVPDVEAFPGHIACSSLSRSEIVVPVFSGDEVSAVLDIDSKELAMFDATDALWLEKIVTLL